MNTFYKINLILTSADYAVKNTNETNLCCPYLEEWTGLRDLGSGKTPFACNQPTPYQQVIYWSSSHEVLKVPGSATFAQAWGRELFEKLENQETISF